VAAWVLSCLSGAIMQSTVARKCLTDDTYSHLMPGMQREAAALVDDFFDGPVAQNGTPGSRAIFTECLAVVPLSHASPRYLRVALNLHNARPEARRPPNPPDPIIVRRSVPERRRPASRRPCSSFGAKNRRRGVAKREPDDVAASRSAMRLAFVRFAHITCHGEEDDGRLSTGPSTSVGGALRGSETTFDAP